MEIILEYESKGVKQNLDIIRPYLSNINDHKTINK